MEWDGNLLIGMGVTWALLYWLLSRRARDQSDELNWREAKIAAALTLLLWAWPVLRFLEH